MTSDDRVHGNFDQKLLESRNIFVDISFNTRRNRMKFETDTPQNFTKYVYAMILLLNECFNTTDEQTIFLRK